MILWFWDSVFYSWGILNLIELFEVVTIENLLPWLPWKLNEANNIDFVLLIRYIIDLIAFWIRSWASFGSALAAYLEGEIWDITLLFFHHHGKNQQKDT